ncbi:MAG: S8 family serine peptidase [Anaerolineae bacterium]
MNRNRFAFLVVLLLLTTLVPSINAQQSTSGYYYYASGQVINLQVSTEWVAVRLGRGRTAANTPALTTVSGIGDVSQAIEVDSPRVTLLPLAAGNSTAATASAIQRSTTLNVEWANPVFTYGDAEYFVSDQFMAAFPASMTEAQINAYNAQYSVQVVQRMPNSLENLYLLQVTAASGRNALDMANLYQTGGVALYGSPNFGRLYNRGPQRNFVPNDGYFTSQWHLNNTAQYIGATADADIDAPEAWEYTQGSNSVIVAYLDDGMQLNHPDLSSKYISAYDPAANPDDFDPSPTTAVELANDAHGTNVAGLIAAATNNTTGVSGVCPNCRLMPIRIGYSLSASFWYVPSDAIVSGFDWARTHNAAVISNSWSGGLPDTAITNAITNAINLGRGGLGAVVTFAAGNDEDAPVDYPSNLSNVMTVGATNWCDQRKSTQSTSCNDYPYEIWGNNTGSSLDVAAPGMDLYSTDSDRHQRLLAVLYSLRWRLLPLHEWYQRRDADCIRRPGPRDFGKPEPDGCRSTPDRRIHNR